MALTATYAVIDHRPQSRSMGGGHLRSPSCWCRRSRSGSHAAAAARTSRASSSAPTSSSPRSSPGLMIPTTTGVRHRALPRSQARRDVAPLPVASACSNTRRRRSRCSRTTSRSWPAGAPSPRVTSWSARYRGAALGCIGAMLADRTRRESWKQSVALVASDQRTRVAPRCRAHPSGDRARDQRPHRSADRARPREQPDRGGAALRLLHHPPDRRAPPARPWSWPRNASEPALRAQILAFETPLDTPVMREVLAGRAVVINDPHQAGLAAGGRPRARPASSAWRSTPITAKGSVVGLLVADPHRVDAPRRSTSASVSAAQGHRLAGRDRDRERPPFDGLAASEASYRDLFERATDLIFVIDEHGGIQFANRAALDFVGVRFRARWPACAGISS